MRFLLMPGGRYSSLIRPKGKRIEEKRGCLDCSFSLFGISRRIDAFAGMEIWVKKCGRRTTSKFLTNMFGGIFSGLGCFTCTVFHCMYTCRERSFALHLQRNNSTFGLIEKPESSALEFRRSRRRRHLLRGSQWAEGGKYT